MAEEFTKVDDIKNNPFLNTESPINVSEPEKFTKVEDIEANNSILKNSRTTDSFKSQQPAQREEKVEVEKNFFGSSYIRRDEKGNVSSRREYSSANQFTGETKYSYDERGRVVSEEEFDRHEMPSGSRKYAYDENGQKYETRYDKDGRMTSQRKYDKDGKEQSVIKFDGDGKIESAVSYAYRESGKVAQETVYEMVDGKMRVAEQAFYDDDENKHSRVLGKDGAVSLKTQARGASMPSAVNDVTQGEIARMALTEAEVAKWHQKYLDEVAFYDDKPAPAVDPWIATFGENGKEAPAKEAVKETARNDVKQSEPEQKAAAENLPSVRGNSMPERARAETSAERGNADPNMPAVRGNAMPEKARATENVGKEEALADSFVAFAKNRTRESAQQLFNSLRDMDRDFLRQGLTAEEMKEKMSAVMATAFDKGVAAGMNADALNKDIAAFSKQFEERLKNAAHAPEQPTAAATRLDDKANTGAKAGLENIEDAEYEDVTNDPAYANAAGLPAKSAENEKEKDGKNKTVPENEPIISTEKKSVKVADERFDANGNLVSGTYYDNDGNVTQTVSVDKDGARLTSFYDSDGSVRAEQRRSADGKTVSHIDYAGGLTHTDLFNDQGKPVYSLSYYQDGGKLYPWNERTTEYDENGKPTVSSKSFGIDGADGEKSAEELMDSVAYKDEWLFNKFAEHAGAQAEAEKTVEKEENAAEQVAPEQARQNDDVVDTASEPEKADERVAEPAQDRPVENEPVSAAPVVENDGNEAETADRAAPENTGNDNGGQQGGFGVAGYDDDVNTNTDENAGADGKADDDKANAAQGQDSASLDQLHAEMEAVAAKINYHMSEQDEFCPYSTIKCSSFVESKDEKNPFVQATMRPSGSTLINMPDKINIKFNTVVETDGKQNTQLTLEDCMAMVRMGMEKGWTSATLSGPPEFKKQMYLAMRAMGMEPVGYTPSAELAKQGDAMFKSNAQNREHNASIDKRFPEMESERKAAGVEIDGIDKELTDSFKGKGIGYEPKTPDEKSAESKDNADQKDAKQSEQDSKTEEKAPQAEEKAPQVEEKAPQTEEKTPQIEEKAPQVEEKAPQSEEKTPQVEEKAPQVEEKAPQQQEQAPLGLPNPEQGKTREQEQAPRQPQPERKGHAPLGLPNLKQQEADQHQPPAPVLPGKTQLALPDLPPEKGKELSAKFTYMVEDLAAKNPQVAGYLAAGLGKADKSPSTMLRVYGGAANEVKALEVKPNTRANSNANTNLPSVIKRKGELDR